jgi:hypothetical protein
MRASSEYHQAAEDRTVRSKVLDTKALPVTTSNAERLGAQPFYDLAVT